MHESEIRDTLAAEFFLHQVRATVGQCEDLVELREMVVQLVDLLQHQKAMFRHLIGVDESDLQDTGSNS